MSRGERLNFDEFSQYFVISDVGGFTISGAPDPTQNRRAVWANDGAPVKAEPSQDRYGRFDDLNRIIFFGSQQTAAPADITFQPQLSRDGTNFVNIGSPVNPFGARTGLEQGVPVQAVWENPLPPDLFTDPAGATAITDDVFGRVEIDGLNDSGSYAYCMIFVPSLGSTGARYGQRGNVFSGPSY